MLSGMLGQVNQLHRFFCQLHARLFHALRVTNVGDDRPVVIRVGRIVQQRTARRRADLIHTGFDHVLSPALRNIRNAFNNLCHFRSPFLFPRKHLLPAFTAFREISLFSLYMYAMRGMRRAAEHL